MKVLLFSPRAKKDRESAVFPLGLLSIASHLKRCGHSVKLVDRNATSKDYKKVIKNFKPDIVGISFLTTKTTDDIIAISDYAHSKGIPVIFGNTLASATAEVLLNDGYADYVGIGEGEFVFEDLLEALERRISVSQVKGLAFKEGDEIVFTELRPFAEGSQLPQIDWTLIDPLKYAQPIYGCKKMGFVYASKGCPANCAFCFNEVFHKRERRTRPYEIIVSEIRDLVETYGFDGIFFGDELWSASREELYEKCKAIKEIYLPFVWGCHLKVGMYNQEDYHFMYDCGCRWIFYGVESGSVRILQQINKRMKPEWAIDTIRMTYEAGIMTLPSFIIEFPDEGEDDLRQTVELIKAIQPYSNAKAFFLSPLIGTQLYFDLLERDVIKKTENTGQLDTQWNEFKKNYSNIPTEELKVVYSHIIWWSITNNVKNIKEKDKKRKGYLHPFKVMLSVFGGLKQSGMKRIVPNLFYTTIELAKILFCFYEAIFMILS